MARTVKGTWRDPAIVDDPRIDHDNEDVRAAAEYLHRNESLDKHVYIGSEVCPYCAMRASRVLAVVEARRIGLLDRQPRTTGGSAS